MKKIFVFYLKTFLIINALAIPFAFIAFPDLEKNELTLRIFISSFLPQAIYMSYLIWRERLFPSLKAQLTRSIKPKDILLSFSCIVFPIIIFILINALDLIKIQKNEINIFNICLYIVPLFLSAFVEEIIFRFLPFKLLNNKPTIKDILLISLLFGVFHILNPNFNMIGFVNIILAGVFLSLVYLITDSIITASLAHFFWNFVMGCILGSNISGMKVESIIKYESYKPYYLTGGDFGFEGSILTSILFLLAIFILYKKYFNKKH